MRDIGHMIPKHHASHPGSYPLCLKKSMWLIIQGDGVLTSRQWLQINDTHATRMVV